jgi:hypothetical protein
MSRIEQLEDQFRALHRVSYQEYSESIQQAREQYEFQVSQRKGGEEQERSAIDRISHTSAEEQARVDRERQQGLKEHVQEIRSRLVERQSRQPQSSKRLAVLGQPPSHNLMSIPIYATSVMSDKTENVADIQGEHGNPWVLPWNPEQIKISQSASGNEYGLCGWARLASSPVIADVWFAFIPFATGLWYFQPWVEFFGFYMLNAIRGFLLCRDSRVTLDVSLNVYQYFWFGENSFSLLNEDSDYGFRYGFVDTFGHLGYSAHLRADPDYYAFLRVRISILADAYGSGAWSEINFKDGTANFIKPVALNAYFSG